MTVHVIKACLFLNCSDVKMAQYNYYAFIFIMLVSCSTVRLYNLKCPSTSQWNFRSGFKCTPPSTNNLYTCLWNNITKDYQEYCGYEEVSKQGNKYILMPNPQQVPCSASSYQPFKFTSIGNSKCIYKKSMCSGEGQVIADSSSTTNDIRCRCDYTRGYVFIHSPRNKCTCIPSQEDCSCISKPCVETNLKLKKDYKCYNDDLLPERIPCEEITVHTQGVNTDTAQNPHSSEWNAEKLIIRSVSSAFVQILVTMTMGLAILSALLLILPQPFKGSYIISVGSNVMFEKETNRHQVLEGDVISLRIQVDTLYKWRTMTWQKRKIDDGRWKDICAKDNVNIVFEDTNYTLTINNITKADSGSYRCIIKLCKTAMSLRTKCNFIQEIPVVDTNEDNVMILEVIHFQSYGSETVEEQFNATLSTSSTFDQSINSAIWLKQTSKLSKVEIDTESNEFESNNKKTSNLTIRHCTDADSGTYLCVVMGPEGIIENACLQIRLDVVSNRDKAEIIPYVSQYLNSNKFDKQWFRILLQNISKACLVKYHWMERGQSIYSILKNENNENLKRIIVEGLNSVKLLEIMQYKSTKGKVCFVAWDIITMLEQIIWNGKNLYIYENEISDFMLMSGFIIAAKNGYFQGQSKFCQALLSIALTKLDNNESNKHLLESLETDFDGNGNRFFHYLVLFGSNEALPVLFIFEKEIEFSNIQNKFSQTPIEMAAFLGKLEIVQTLFRRASSLDLTRFRDIVKYGKQKFYTSNQKRNPEFEMLNSFETRVLKYSIYGNKSEYDAILKFLNSNDEKK